MGIDLRAWKTSIRTSVETDMGDISQILPAVHAYVAIAPETVAD